MFHRLGKIVVCYRVLIICLWLGLTAGMLFAPSLRSVGTADETSFLPTGAESMTARQLAADEFPSGAVDSAGVLVFFNPDGLSERDRAYAEEVATWLATAGPREVGQVVSAFGHPEMRDLLVSRDGRTMLLQVSFNVAPFHEPANQAVAAIRERVGDAPPGLEVRVTGEAGIGADFLAAINRSTSRATVVTVALVVLVVLLVYRSPVAALVPLATVGVAFLTSRGLLGLLAAAGLNVSSLLDSFLVVLVFGVGTDYSLFIISRYREELAGRDRTAAATETVGRMGPVIVSSAATVIIGLLSLGVASYRLTRTIGPAMGLAVAVTLSASLTLTPALFSLFGRRLFWPFAESAGTAEGRGFWSRLAGAVTRRPIVVSLVALTLLVLPMARLPAMVLSFNLLAELPATTDSVRGFTIIAEHFEQGDMMPVSVLIQAPSDLTEAAGLARTVKLTKALEAVPGVERVVAVTSPTADEASGHRLTVPGQLSALVTGLEQGLNPGEGLVVDAEVIASPAATQGLEMMRVYLDDLGRSFPGLRDDSYYQKATGALGALGRALADARRGARPDNQLRLLADGLGAATAASAVPSEGASLAELTAGFVQLEVVPSYLSELAAQFPALLDNPAYADAVSALVELDRVKQALSVDGQLLEMAAQLRTSAGAVGDGEVAAMGGRAGADDSAGPFGGLRSYLEGLAGAYPGLVSDQDYREAMATLTDLERTLTGLEAAGRAYSFQAPLAFLSPAAQDYVRAGRDRIVGAPAALAAGLKRL
ncbi:MAG TPA: MMPL family transporter, partial [Bacillota bacterium]